MKLLFVLIFVVCFSELCMSVLDRQLHMGHDCPLHSPKSKRHLIECNLCKCYQGNLYDCTHYVCSSDNLIAGGSEMVCVEKEMKWDECTLCRCHNNTWICMQSTCRSPKRRRSVYESFCIFDGMKKYQDCNECICRNGKWHCSENTCAAKNGMTQYITFFETDLEQVPCSPNDVLAIDCSLCRCNDNSLGYDCQSTNDCNEDQPLSLKIRSAKAYIDNIMQD